MRARWLGLAALAALAPLLAGCGGAGAEPTEAAGNELAVYASLPLQGGYAAISQQIVNGEKLALADAKGRAGRFKVGYVLLDDSNPASGRWDPGVTAGNAKTAAQDTSTIAYLGELDSAATAISLPLMNAARILQVTPVSPYVGLTSSLDAGQDEPERFYPSGRRTFGRLAPGDPVEAAAQARLMAELGVHSVYVLDDQDPFQAPLADLVAADARAGGIAVAGRDSLSLPPGGLFTGEVEKIRESHAEAVFLSGSSGLGEAALWRALHAAEPHLLLLGSSTMLGEPLFSQLGSASTLAYFTTPALAPADYPPAAQRVLASYRRRFGANGDPYALYGYETMDVVLAAIRAAGAHGNDRQQVIAHFFSTRERDSVLGRYSIEPGGESTLRSYGVDRVRSGRAVFYRAIETR